MKYYRVFWINKKIFFPQYNIRILEIDNCYKCDLETINDPNNSQYSWINRRDLEIETNVTGKLFLISVKTYRLKNIEKN